MAEVKLCDGVYQDGGQFYHEELGLIADFGDIRDWDTRRADMARIWFAEKHPEYAYFDRETGGDDD